MHVPSPGYSEWLTLGNDNPQTETLFHTYSQFSTAANIPPKPTDQERETEAKIQELLEKVSPSSAPFDACAQLPCPLLDKEYGKLTRAV